MAERPVFMPRTNGVRLVEEVPVEFKWHSGFASIQKKKNIAELHEAAKQKGLRKVLEVSTKSEENLGVRLSAFSLKVDVPGIGKISLESAYQGSKVFSRGGPFTDLYLRKPREAKRDERLKTSGKLVGFQFGDTHWELEPKTAFYDWLYLRALYEFREYLERLFDYDGFTDIEFNPKSSLNCQARSCAIFVSLMKKQLLKEAAEDREAFISILRPDSLVQPHSQDLKQGQLF
jgi:hypothetical protein